MNNNNLTLERFIVWEEKDSIEPKKKLENNGENKQIDIINKTKNEFVKKECEDIGKKKKICYRCNQFKELSNFNKCSKSKDGLDFCCRNCSSLRCKKYHNKNRNKRNKQLLEYYSKNKNNIKLYHKKYMALYRQNPKNKIDRNKKWKIKYENNVYLRIESILRSRYQQAMTKKYKQTSIMNLIGCSVNELRKYIESKFVNGMSWKNQGEWHIDHIIPCASFDLTKLEEQKKCFNYTNLQPLWAKDNLSKGSKIIT